MKKGFQTLSACEYLMQQYWDKGGCCVTVEEGVLGLGTVVCFADGYKTTVIREYFINSQSSGHTVRMYNKMPKKYAKMLEELGM